MAIWHAISTRMLVCCRVISPRRCHASFFTCCCASAPDVRRSFWWCLLLHFAAFSPDSFPAQRAFGRRSSRAADAAIRRAALMHVDNAGRRHAFSIFIFLRYKSAIRLLFRHTLWFEILLHFFSFSLFRFYLCRRWLAGADMPDIFSPPHQMILLLLYIDLRFDATYFIFITPWYLLLYIVCCHYVSVLRLSFSFWFRFSIA